VRGTRWSAHCRTIPAVVRKEPARRPPCWQPPVERTREETALLRRMPRAHTGFPGAAAAA